MRRLLPLILSLGLVELAVVALLVLAPSPSDPALADDAIAVVVSVAPQAFLVNRIGGEQVEVTVMIPQGASPATYEPPPSQMRRLAQAELYVKVGHPVFPFEQAWLGRVLQGYPNLRVIDSSEGVPLIPDDPHLWLSPAAMRIQARHIAEELGRARPALVAEFQANLQQLLGEIDALDEELRQILSPLEQRSFLVFHPSWGYFARDYGLHQIAIEHHHTEPSPADVRAIIDLARERGIRVVFVQPEFDRRHAAVIAAEVGAEVVTINPLAPDWIANMRLVGQTFASTLE